LERFGGWSELQNAPIDVVQRHRCQIIAIMEYEAEVYAEQKQKMEEQEREAERQRARMR